MELLLLSKLLEIADRNWDSTQLFLLEKYYKPTKDQEYFPAASALIFIWSSFQLSLYDNHCVNLRENFYWLY